MDELELMRLHVEALFGHDAAGDMLRVNEPNGAPAPRFFVGRTAQGSIRRFRGDVTADARGALQQAWTEDSRREPSIDSPLDPSRYEAILARWAPLERTHLGPAFACPVMLPSSTGVELVTEANAAVLTPHLAPWIPDVRLNPPLFALVIDGQAAAVCASVRRTAEAHEAGVETAMPFRGHGYATRVTAVWARAVRAMGRVPLYSTSWSNAASRSVARKLGLIQFGNDMHIT